MQSSSKTGVMAVKDLGSVLRKRHLEARSKKIAHVYEMVLGMLILDWGVRV